MNLFALQIFELTIINGSQVDLFVEWIGGFLLLRWEMQDSRRTVSNALGKDRKDVTWSVLWAFQHHGQCSWSLWLQLDRWNFSEVPTEVSSSRG